MMEKLMELKGETEKFKVKLKILTPSSLQLVDRATKKKISKYIDLHYNSTYSSL